MHWCLNWNHIATVGLIVLVLSCVVSVCGWMVFLDGNNPNFDRHWGTKWTWLFIWQAPLMVLCVVMGSLWQLVKYLFTC